MSITTEIQQFQDETREGWMPEKQPVPDYGEPWEYTSFRNCIRDRHNVLRQIEDDLRDRSRSCVNVGAGMVDPAAEIQAMREAIRVAHRFIRDIVKNHECGDNTDASGEAVLAKLQPFLP